jgi:hypothetical protein
MQQCPARVVQRQETAGDGEGDERDVQRDDRIGEPPVRHRGADYLFFFFACALPAGGSGCVASASGFL